MRYYALFAMAMIMLALAMPYLGVRTRDRELTVTMQPNGSLIPSTPTYERPPPRPYDYVPEWNFPDLGKGSTLVLLSTHDTQSISSTALANQEEIAVGAGTLVIEEGETPLYVILISFDATIWEVKGAVERVRYLVLGSEASNATIRTMNEPHTERLVGETGLSADKVRFLENKCLHYFKDRAEEKLAADAVEHYVGQRPDVVAGAEHVNGFSAPSGNIDQLSTGRSPLKRFIRRAAVLLGLKAALNPAEESIQNDLDHFSPGGVKHVDPTLVVSAQPASQYRVLPEEAGILQLLHSGGLSPGKEDGTIYELERGISKDFSFVINRPIQLPAGLYGGHSRNFVLAAGLPLPTGRVAHSCVRSQSTGKVLLGEKC